MKNVFNALIQNKEIITLIFSFAITMSTIIYAILTWCLIRETRKMRKAQTEPNVSVYVQPSHVWMHFFDFVVKNIGLGPAYDVKFKILEEFAIKNDRKLSDIDFMKEGINYMPPNYSVSSYFFNILGQYEEIINKSLKIKVMYKNSERQDIVEIIHINMSQFKGMQKIGEDPLHKIAQSIENIKSNIDKISSGYHRLQVDTYTAEDREKAKVELEKHRQEFIKKQSEQNNK